MDSYTLRYHAVSGDTTVITVVRNGQSTPCSAKRARKPEENDLQFVQRCREVGGELRASRMLQDGAREHLQDLLDEENAERGD